jgi:hypothetical protein
LAKTIGDITRTIIELENRYDLFSWEIEHVFIWEILRSKVYQAAIDTMEAGVQSQQSSRSPNEKIKKIANKIRKFLNSILYHPFFDQKKVDCIVFESSRKVKYQNYFIDPFTHFTVKELRNSNKKLAIYQSSYTYDKLAKRSLANKHLDILEFINGIKMKLKPVELQEKDIQKINQIQSILKETLSVKLPLSSIIEKEINLFKNNYSAFEKILKNKQPKEIYIVNFCDKPALIAVAKKLNITILDIQHGLISSEDIIYHYPNVAEASLHYFPDKFLAWSKMWGEVCKLPIQEQYIIEHGNKYLSEQQKNYKQVPKNEKGIIIISQPGLTDQIAQQILKNDDFFSEYSVTYKLHPNEYALMEKYPSVMTLQKKKNVFFADKLTDLYQLFSKNRIVLGVYSTALIEALEFNCNVFLFDLPGIEMMAPFIKNENVSLFNTIQSEHSLS